MLKTCVIIFRFIKGIFLLLVNIVIVVIVENFVLGIALRVLYVFVFLIIFRKMLLVRLIYRWEN